MSAKRFTTRLVALCLTTALLFMGCGSDSDDEVVQHVTDSLSSLREAEETYFDMHGHYSDRFPDLQTIGPAGVSGSLGTPALSYSIETSSRENMVTVSVRAVDDSDVHGWFSLLNGREYGFGGYALQP